MRTAWALIAAGVALIPATANGQDRSDAETASPPPAARAPPETVETVNSLPDGLVRTVLERLPEGQADLIVKVSHTELEAARRALERGEITAEDLARETEAVLGFRAGMLAAAGNEALARRLVPDLTRLTPSELVTSAYASDSMASRAGQLIGRDQRLEVAEQLLSVTPFLYRPNRPCGEGGTLANRQSDCVDRAHFRSAVGIGWRTPNGIEIRCSGQLLDRRTVITADHCIPSDDVSEMVVLSHFTGGTATARRMDGTTYTGVRVHAVRTPAHRDPGINRLEEIRSYDIATVELAEDAPIDVFPTLAGTFPVPLNMTVAGWGRTDAAMVGNVGLEVTIVSLSGDNRLTRTGATLTSWPASLSIRGSGFCQGDSGGPIYAGAPDAQGQMQLRLLGLVAGGNENCRAGNQYITDLTRNETRAHLCRLARDAAICRPG